MNVNYAVKPSTLQQNCSVTSSSTALRGWVARSSALSASQVHFFKYIFVCVYAIAALNQNPDWEVHQAFNLKP